MSKKFLLNELFDAIRPEKTKHYVYIENSNNTMRIQVFPKDRFRMLLGRCPKIDEVFIDKKDALTTKDGIFICNLSEIDVHKKARQGNRAYNHQSEEI